MSDCSVDALRRSFHEQAKQLAAAKAENERLKKIIDCNNESTCQIAAKHKQSEAAKEAALAEAARVLDLLKTDGQLKQALRERDAALALVETLKSNRYRELLADACIERDAAVQAKERAEADAAVMRATLAWTLQFREFSDSWHDPDNKDVVHFRELRSAALATNAGASLLEERDRLRALRDVVVEHLRDHQCAQKCDGPHEDCPCWYCRMAALAQQPDQRKDG